MYSKYVQCCVGKHDITLQYKVASSTETPYFTVPTMTITPAILG